MGLHIPQQRDKMRKKREMPPFFTMGGTEMYKQCHTEKSAQRQRDIAGVMVELLQTDPLEEVTVAQLCRRGGIPRKTFYRYFDTKEDILAFLADGVYYRVKLAWGEHTTTDLTTCVAMFRFWEERPELLYALFGGRQVSVTHTRIVQLTVEEELRKKTITSAQEPGAARHVFWISGFVGLLRYWIKDGMTQPSEEMGRLFYHLMTDPQAPLTEGKLDIAKNNF
jgi:AcrR family transcriptional regulator